MISEGLECQGAKGDQTDYERVKAGLANWPESAWW